MDDSPPRVGISSCLLGNPVRSDGGHRLARSLRDTLGAFVTWVTVCPEVQCGLPVPREALRLVGESVDPRLVTIRTGADHTAGMQAWAARRLDELAGEDLCGFVLKRRSPSSGMRQVKGYPPGGGAPSTAGVGVNARAFTERFPHLPVEDEGRLNDPAIREGFIERLFVLARWKRYRREDGTAGGLVAFHTDRKLLALAHSLRAFASLGKLVAGAGAKGRRPAAALLDAYVVELMASLRSIATRARHVNALQQAAGHYQRVLTAVEKAELAEPIDSFRRGPWLSRQRYLHPHPRELMLRNHA